MRGVFAGFTCLVSSVLLFGQDAPASAEDVIKGVLQTLDQITASLKTVEDEKTAEAARPDIRKAVDRFVDLRKKGENLKPPDKEEKARLEKEYKQKLVDAHKKLFGEIGRLRSVPGGREVLKDLAALGSYKKPLP